MNKKAMAMNLVITAAILIIVFAVIAISFPRLFGKEKGIVEEKISSLSDPDSDQVANMFDKCPCVPGTDTGISGCPTDPPEPAHMEDRTCFAKK